MKRKYDASDLMVLTPGIMPEDGYAERVAEKAKTTKFNKDIRHLQRRIAESDGRDRDAEILLAEVLLKDEKWRPEFGPERAA